MSSLRFQHQEQLIQAFCKLGLSLYQAKIYSALAALGPAGIAEIQHVSGVPRTKIYEILEQLVTMGAVEFQSGRPVIYNALSPAVLVDRMRNTYLTAADDATRLLAEIQQTEKNTNEDLVWVVRGPIATRRKIALTIASAKKSIIMVEQYPVVLMPTALPVIKSMIQKNIKARVVCILKEGQHLDDRLKAEELIEFRKATNMFSVTDSDDDISKAFHNIVLAIFSRKACLTIVDDQEAFVYWPDKFDNSKSMGLTIKIPGLPMIQRILFERLMSEGTIQIK